MLMAWGPYRFTVPNYSIETIRRAHQSRAEAQPIIGRAPTIHRLGPNNPTISLSSTFHPRHMNGRGLQQLAGVRQAVDAGVPLQLTHINASEMNIFGAWIATSVESDETLLDVRGIAQIVTVTLNMMLYSGSPGRQAALSAVMSGGLSIGGGVGGVSLAASIGVGF